MFDASWGFMFDSLSVVMLITVTTASWEGIGLASYLLINFWVTRHQANKAGLKAMLVNKIGDFGLALGILGKSSQIGLHTWLPDAMEGPTPVSALIHAATLVTAGVFLMARSSPLLEYSPQALALICFTGAMTCFLAASTGIMQNDLKRVIAYSTCSQLGILF
eukprot:9504190-Pyramimonas_sp.AAC.1